MMVMVTMPVALVLYWSSGMVLSVSVAMEGGLPCLILKGVLRIILIFWSYWLEISHAFVFQTTNKNLTHAICLNSFSKWCKYEIRCLKSGFQAESMVDVRWVTLHLVSLQSIVLSFVFCRWPTHLGMRTLGGTNLHRLMWQSKAWCYLI